MRPGPVPGREQGVLAQYQVQARLASSTTAPPLRSSGLWLFCLFSLCHKADEGYQISTHISQNSGGRFLEALLSATSSLLQKRKGQKEEGKEEKGEEGDQGIRRGRTRTPNPGKMPSLQLLQRATHQTSYNSPPGRKNPPELKRQPQTPSSHFREASDP